MASLEQMNLSMAGVVIGQIWGFSYCGTCFDTAFINCACDKFLYLLRKRTFLIPHFVQVLDCALVFIWAILLLLQRVIFYYLFSLLFYYCPIILQDKKGHQPFFVKKKGRKLDSFDFSSHFLLHFYLFFVTVCQRLLLERIT
jgi:hypothetical protein